MTGAPVVHLEGVRRSFGGRPALEGVDLEVSAGEVVGLLGPNGAGKTTTMRIIAGVLRADAGTVRVHRPLGYLPERHAGYEALTVRGYLGHLARLRRAGAAEVDEVTARTGLEDLAGRPVGRLSKGQRQRVGLAQALLGRPPVQVLDEPTGGLDPGQRVAARALIREVAAEGAAVIVSTHLLAEAAATCDRVVILAAGRVVARLRTDDAAELERAFLAAAGGGSLAGD